MATWGIKKLDLPKDYVLVEMESFKGMSQVQKDLKKPMLKYKNILYVIDGKTIYKYKEG